MTPNAVTTPHAHTALPLVDIVVRGGRISTMDDEGPAEVEAVAIAGGRIIATGSDADIDPYADAAARVIELKGRRALPGLNDSHIHAVRAANSWQRSMHWEGVRSIGDALSTIRAEVRRRAPGDWISVMGGWHSSQLRERRAPTRAELDAAAPDNPVYVQELYDRGVLNSVGLRACDWDDESADPVRGSLERDETGRLSGVIRGVGAFSVPVALALAGDDAPELGVAEMCRVFAAHGLTGVVDGGGLLMTPRDYDPLYEVWRRGELPMRFRLFVSAWTRGGEVDDIDRLTTLIQPESGDAMLRLAGVGEIPHLGCHDMEGFAPFEMTDAAYAELVEIVRLCVARGWRMSIHAVLDSSLGRILDAWEQVEDETGGIRGRGFSIVHADGASERNTARIARLGAGVLVQNRLVLKGADYVEAWGADATAAAPPIGLLREHGIMIGGGTDATRANWFSPWAAIWWLVTGGTLDGTGKRSAEHRMSVAQAIASYTCDAAWFTGEQDHRGRIRPGYDADLCVPTADPFECQEETLHDILSDLTIVDGRITHDTGMLT